MIGLPRLLALGDAWFGYLASDIFAGGCFLCAASAEMDGRPGPVRDAVAAVMREWIAVLGANVTAAVAGRRSARRCGSRGDGVPAERARHGRQLAAATAARTAGIETRMPHGRLSSTATDERPRAVK